MLTQTSGRKPGERVFEFDLGWFEIVFGADGGRVESSEVVVDWALEVVSR